MARQNNITPFVRSCVALWLANNRLPEFTVAELIIDLQRQHTSLVLIDISKAVSNELYRLETFEHRLKSRKGVKGVDGCGVGRPPRVYRKRKHDEPLQKSENNC